MKQVVAVIVVATLGWCILFMMSAKGDDKASQIKPTGLPKTIIGKDGAEMVLIPAGEFLMGSPDRKGNSDEHPQHTVYLNAFYIDKYEVTNAQYKKFVDATGYEAPGYFLPPSGKANNANDFNKPNQPVAVVSWDDAEAYCKWANKRLPTEAEWEKAARGIDGRRYPWGNDAPNAGGIRRANYIGNDDGFQYTSPVGSFPAGVSPYGVHDMAGNVREWVADWYDGGYYYSVSSKNNPKGPSSGSKRVLRGGSWLKPYYFYRIFDVVLGIRYDDTLRAAKRDSRRPDGNYPTTGFGALRMLLNSPFTLFTYGQTKSCHLYQSINQ